MSKTSRRFTSALLALYMLASLCFAGAVDNKPPKIAENAPTSEETGSANSGSETGIFPDVLPGDVYYEAVQWMAERGFIQGYADGKFHPKDEVSGGAFAKMLISAMTDYGMATIDESDNGAFGPYTDTLLRIAFRNAEDNDELREILESPYEALSRRGAFRELSATVEGLIGESPFYEKFPDADWTAEYDIRRINDGGYYHIIQGDAEGNLRPDDGLTRGAATILIYRFMRIAVDRGVKEQVVNLGGQTAEYYRDQLTIKFAGFAEDLAHYMVATGNFQTVYLTQYPYGDCKGDTVVSGVGRDADCKLFFYCHDGWNTVSYTLNGYMTDGVDSIEEILEVVDNFEGDPRPSVIPEIWLDGGLINLSGVTAD